MENISIKKLFEEKIESIWNDSKYDGIKIRDFGYAIQDNQIKNSLLFIGINPSNSENDSQKSFYVNDNVNAHRYFNKFIEISKEVKMEWSHIDLLFVRDTNQNNVKYLLYKGDELVKEFFEKQLELSKQMIEITNPEIIVVNNTLARDILGFYGGGLGYTFEFDNNFGTHIITNKNSNLYGKPVFFTSMLTGQRALDIGSYQRLVWHIKYVNNKIKK